MKRTRSPSIDSDAASAGAASSSLEPAESASRASSTTSSSAVEEFEEPSAMPLLFILSPVLGFLKEKEVFAEALKRLAKENAEGLGQLTELHRTALAQHELVLLHMTRESILLKALAESRRGGGALPHAWVLRWTARPAVEHGPFTDDAVRKWSSEGFFKKKEGELRDINVVGSAWVPAAKAAAEL